MAEELSLEEIRSQWLNRWPEALAIWSKFTRLSEPRFCLTLEEEEDERLEGSFAMIRLDDQAVVLSLTQIRAENLERFALEIMGHEIGHHVYCPGDLRDQARMIARMRRALPSQEQHAGMIANLYADLFINDRLQRSAGLDMAGVYRALGAGSEERLWTFYMRIYEVLWALMTGDLATGAIDKQLEGDAQLGARMIRVYARDWLKGSGRFAALCLPYLMEDNDPVYKLMEKWGDTRDSGNSNTVPPGLAESDEEEGDIIHPSLDPELNDAEQPIAQSDIRDEPDSSAVDRAATKARTAGKQFREPFEYGAILKSLGIDLTDHQIAVRYYRERAMPYIIRFPTRIIPEAVEPLPEGLEPWSIGASLDDIDWVSSVFSNGRIVPGMTTLQRIWGTSSGHAEKRNPVDLDLYVDSSGSIANPQFETSYLALAGAIIALSALRVGSRVQVTLWSGTEQVMKTDGFTTNEQRILEILTGYFGGATAFPIHVLRDTFQNRTKNARPVHIMVISDEGVDTMFDKDEQGGSGWDISSMALHNATGGGSLVLNVGSDYHTIPALVKAEKLGWQIYPVRSWNDLTIFAKRFSEEKYADKISSALARR